MPELGFAGPGRPGLPVDEVAGRMRDAPAGEQSDPAHLIGRDPECAALAAVLESARSGSSDALMIVGDAGVGKTALLQFAAANAPDFLQLVVIGVEAESSFAYAAIHRLLLPVLDRLNRLPVPQRDALAVVFGLAGKGSPDRFLVGLGVLTVLADIADERPVLCIVDDAQWLDQESVDLLAFVRRRLLADGVAVIVAARSTIPGWTETEDIRTVQLAGLSPGDTRLLLAREVGDEVDESVAAQIIRDTEGCPLAVMEVARQLSPEELAGSALVPDALPIGQRLESFFSQRVRALPGGVQEFLLLVACATGEDNELARRAAELLGIGAEGEEGARDAKLLDPGPVLRFRHPLMRSAVLSSTGASRRRRAHDALFRALGPEASPFQSAWHRAGPPSAPTKRSRQSWRRPRPSLGTGAAMGPSPHTCSGPPNSLLIRTSGRGASSMPHRLR